jgi:hypothetical protein
VIAARHNRATALLAALVVAGVTLIAVELGKGATNAVSPVPAKPCQHRAAFPGGGFDATVQRVVLDGLDGAACRLGVTREDLVLSLGPGTTERGPRWDRHTIETAVRAGMLRALDEAQRRGDVPGFLAPLLRELVEKAPLDTLIRGAFSLPGL